MVKARGCYPIQAEIIEIGVGFGGLAAMNALVSRAITTLVDLPQVRQTAARILDGTKYAGFVKPDDVTGPGIRPLVVSNYAFTELAPEIQDSYLDRYLKRAERGVISSNSSVFAGAIGGRTDEELVRWLRNAGMPAEIESANELLAPGDHLCGVRMIRW